MALPLFGVIIFFMFGCIMAPSNSDHEMNYDVRLVDGTSYSGRVEVYLDGYWGTVCDDFWDINDANVICRSLGYPLGALNFHSQAYFGEGSDRIVLDNVQCTGNEASIQDCRAILGHTSHNCGHGEDAGVTCNIGSLQDDPDNSYYDYPVPYDVRLAGGTPDMGRVEIYFGGEWGTVCDDFWDIHDADIICRALGYPSGAVSALSNAYFGEGSGPIVLNDVHCQGNESHIIECAATWFNANCSHDEDASVMCNTDDKRTPILWVPPWGWIIIFGCLLSSVCFCSCVLFAKKKKTKRVNITHVTQAPLNNAMVGIQGQPFINQPSTVHAIAGTQVPIPVVVGTHVSYPNRELPPLVMVPANFNSNVPTQAVYLKPDL